MRLFPRLRQCARAMTQEETFPFAYFLICPPSFMFYSLMQYSIFLSPLDKLYPFPLAIRISCGGHCIIPRQSKTMTLAQLFGRKNIFVLLCCAEGKDAEAHGFVLCELVKLLARRKVREREFMKSFQLFLQEGPLLHFVLNHKRAM